MMNFNFYDLYKTYPTTELLKIIKQPGDYQPAAVDAATLILSQRQISQEDVEAVEGIFETEASQKQLRIEKFNSYKSKAADFFEAILLPGTEVKVVKWLNIIFIVIAFQCLWQVYTTYQSLRTLFKYDAYVYDYLITLPSVVQLFYLPFLLYLLVKKKRWGWILLFVDTLGSVILMLYSVLSYSESQYFVIDTPDMQIISIVIKTLLIFFLWRKDISDHFQVTESTKRKALWLTPLGCILVYFIIRLLFG
jgi:hypothetical protein